MRQNLLLGAGLAALIAASAPAGAQTLAPAPDPFAVPGAVVGTTVGAAGAVAGAAVAAPAAVVGAVTQPLIAPFPGLAPATASTQAFRAEALRSDAFEIESGRLALERSRDPRVRSHARQMINDHQTTTAALLPPGTSLNASGNVVADRQEGPFGTFGELITAPLTIPVNLVGRTLEGRDLIDNGPATPGRRVALDPRRQAMLGQLASTRGNRDFNATYAKQQVQSHQEAVALYSGYAQNGDDETARTFARQVLPRLQTHLATAQDLDERYANSEPAF